MAFDLFKLAGSIFIDTDEADKSLHKTDQNATSFGETLGKVGNIALGTATMVADFGIQSVEALVDTAMSAAQTADDIDKMSQKIGISAQAYQEWSYILDRNGMDVDKLQTGVKKLSETMDNARNGNKNAIELFDSLGISIKNANGTMKTAEQMFNEVVTSLANMPESAERTALAVDLLGRSATELAPLLNSGSASIEELRQNAHDLGLVMSDEAVKSGAEFTDAMTDLESSFSMLSTNLGTAMLPLLTDLVNMVVEYMPMIQDMVGQFSPILTQFIEALMPMFEELIKNIMPIIQSVFEEIYPIIKQFASNLLPIIVKLIQRLAPFIAELVIKLLPVALELIVQLMPLLDALIPLLDPIIDCTLEIVDILLPVLIQLIPPLIQIITALLNDSIVPLVNFIMGDLTHAINHIIDALLKEAVPSVKSAFEFVIHIIDLFRDLSVGNFDAVRRDILRIVKDLVDGFVNNIVAMANTAINVVNSLVQDVSSAVNKITSMLSFGGKGLSFNVPKIPTIPRLAEGGTVESAGTVLVGEEAPEFLSLPTGARVTPLDKAGVGLSKADLEDAFVNALSRITIPIELQTNDDALFEKVVSKNTEFRRRHSGMSALA